MPDREQMTEQQRQAEDESRHNRPILDIHRGDLVRSADWQDQASGFADRLA